MKKISLLGLLLFCFIFSGCDYNLGDNESVYKGELIIAGVGPDVSFEPTVEEGTLVLKGSFEDHSDHLFLSKGIWEEYFNDESDYLPGNTVKFKGVVEAIDGAAGNHYYNVKSIKKMKVIKYPGVEEIKEIFDGYNYCETDSDCEYFGGECPLGCYIPMNKNYISIANNIVSNFVNQLDERCVYSCLYLDKAVCRDYKCEMINSEAEDINEPIICTSEEKNADFCTMQYDPVCGSDSRTYGNSCVACQSETVESYILGECESSAFSVEGDSKYLQEVEEILEKDGAVTCDLFYTNFGREVHALFMADKNRFYSAMDDYSDTNKMNQTYTLALDGKKYYRSTFPDADNIVEESDIDIESEIASLLMDTGKYPDFKMNCSGGIENENLFSIPN